MFLSLSLCFPASATVITPNGPKLMSEVAIGDVVRVVTPEGRVEWSPVCGWAHRDTTNAAVYLRIKTSHRQIVVSQEHLVATLPNSGSNISFVQAQHIKVGDKIVECDTSATFLTQGGAVWGNAVASVDQVQAQGIYAPLTVAGTIVVDGVAASCYAATHSHRAAHAALKPVRSQWKHHPERVTNKTTAKHIPGAHRYVDVLAHVVGRA